MTIRPVENPATGFWEILQWNPSGQTHPLPAGMRYEISPTDSPDRTWKQRANDTARMVAGQLWSLGITVHLELLEED